MAGSEAPLNPAGLVHELFRDSQGRFWISDFYASEVWVVNSMTNDYSVYQGLSGASSARLDNAGTLWWSDFDANAVGSYKPGESQATRWALPGGGAPLGLAIDAAQRVWVTDAFAPNLYRFDPAVSQLCRYTVPDGGAADYIAAAGSVIWLGDTISGRIARFDPGANSFRLWQLPAGAYPQGLAVAGDGRVWWADNGRGLLGRLDPASNVITSFTIPTANAQPIVVSLEGGKVWYSDFSGAVGVLDPTQTAGAPGTVAPQDRAAQPVCATLGQGEKLSVSTRTGKMSWRPTAYPAVVDNAAWRVFDLPAGAHPWGVVGVGNHAWYVDQGDGGVQRAQVMGVVRSDEAPADLYELYLPVALTP